MWLYDNTEFRIEAFIIGFDEFMNVVLDEAEEVYDCGAKPGKEVKPRRSLGGCRAGRRAVGLCGGELARRLAGTQGTMRDAYGDGAQRGRRWREKG